MLGLLPGRALKNCREISFLNLVELEHKEPVKIEKLNHLIGLVLFSIICGITNRSTRLCPQGHKFVLVVNWQFISFLRVQCSGQS